MLYSLALSLLFSWVSLFSVVEVQTVWGPHTIDDPVIEELLQHPVMQRIKYIDQSGPVAYYGNLAPSFTRYDHCVGVYALLHRFGAPHAEQVSGLLHDASHTAFSHLGDMLFYKPNADKSYQDLIHLEFLEKMGATHVTQQHGISVGQLDPDLPEYTALEQHLPDLCADRIQYIIHTGVVLFCITRADAKFMVDNLEFNGQKWFFVDTDAARMFADLSLYFTRHFWGVEWNHAFYTYFTEILKRAVALNLIHEDDIRYGIDQDILDILQTCSDGYIHERLQACNRIHEHYDVVPYGQGDFDAKPKFRGVDPLIMIDGELVRLTDIDEAYAIAYDEMHAWCRKGYGIKRVNI